MVKIRLSPYGKKGSVIYRIVAVAGEKKVKGKNLEVLGWWNPEKDVLKIDKEKLLKWKNNGAQISAPVAKLLA